MTPHDLTTLVLQKSRALDELQTAWEQLADLLTEAENTLEAAENRAAGRLTDDRKHSGEKELSEAALARLVKQSCEKQRADVNSLRSATTKLDKRRQVLFKQMETLTSAGYALNSEAKLSGRFSA